MYSRLLLLRLVIGFSACSNSNKENKIKEVLKEKEAAPEGVIIQAQTEVDTLKGSLKAYATSKIGNVNFTINYYAPATRGRMIWGGLVAYNNVWVTGAHKATNIEFDTAIKIGETTIPAGKYAFFTIPGKENWIIILNKKWNQHLADEYDQAEDVVRMTVTPEIKETHQERLRYVIEEKSDSTGEIVMHWDKLEIAVPFKLVKR